MSTIYDVASKAGVSVKTVSRVLNNDNPVKMNTRAKVVEAIEELKYVPSHAARMLRSNRSNIIGLITGAISNSPEPLGPSGLPDLHIVKAIQERFSRTGKILMIADTGNKSESVQEIVQKFFQYRVDGLIYVATHHQEVRLNLQASRCPVILANCFDILGTPSILPDDKLIQHNLVERLIQFGHSRIGFLMLDRSMKAAALRKQGYRDALRENGISYDPKLTFSVKKGWQSPTNDILSAGLKSLLSLPNPPSVICCGNDEMAMRILEVLKTMGIIVPDDISVAGFDDNRVIAELLQPQLTSAVLPYRQIGIQTAELLLDLIEGKPFDSTSPVLVSGDIVWRSSVAAINSTKLATLGRV